MGPKSTGWTASSQGNNFSEPAHSCPSQESQSGNHRIGKPVDLIGRPNALRNLIELRRVKQNSIDWYVCEKQRGTISLNSRFPTVLFQQHSANLSRLRVPAARPPLVDCVSCCLCCFNFLVIYCIAVLYAIDLCYDL